MSSPPIEIGQGGFDFELHSRMGTALSCLLLGALAPALLGQPHRHMPFGVALLGSATSLRWLPADPPSAQFLFDAWTGEARTTGHAIIMPRIDRTGRLTFSIAVPKAGRLRLAQAVPHFSPIAPLVLIEPVTVPIEEERPYYPDEPRMPIIGDPGLALIVGEHGWLAATAAFIHGFHGSPFDRSEAQKRLQQIEPVLQLLAQRGGLK